MTKIIIFLCLLFSSALVVGQDKPLNVIVFGAHPDDPDSDAGGSAILWAKMGHKVMFVALTNGDAGHHEMGGGALAKIRRAEAAEAGKRYGIEKYITLDNHDGELMPTLENRLEVIRLIRQWNADL
jgi:LmbE family N-acetylglucosaminyl deacetylase